MFARLTASSSRTLLRRSFATPPPPPPPAAALSRRGLVLGALSVGIAFGGYLSLDKPAVARFASPLMLDSPNSTPKSTEAPIPAPPPSTTSTAGEDKSQIGQGPAVGASEGAGNGGGSEFNDTDVAGASVGGSAPDQVTSVTDGEGIEPSSESAKADPKTQGAFNEETGEINWDCPCLGGMPHGPCGEQFRAAFSCFVYSEEEPKGIECVEKFKDMQECFRAHPEVYGESDYESDDDEAAATPAVETEQAALEPLETQLKEDPSEPFKGEEDERGELFAQDGGVTGEGIGTKTE